MAKHKPELIRITCRYVLLVKWKEKGIIWAPGLLAGTVMALLIGVFYFLIFKNVAVLSYKVNCADFQQSADFL